MRGNSKIYVVSPISSSGGPESLHQLAAELIKLGLDAYIYYEKSDQTIITEKFSKYDVKVANFIEDKPNNIMIVPEVYTDVLYKYRHVKKCIWWLSLDFYLNQIPKNRVRNLSGKYKIPKIFNSILYIVLFMTKRLNFSIFKFKNDKNNYFHFYNCEYVKRYLVDKGVKVQNTMYLCGPLRDEYFSVSLPSKENIIVYNPAKGFGFTKKIIKKSKELNRNFTFIPISNLRPNEIVDLLGRAKVYIDFGYFPGPERIPREAVMLNCNIITSKTGSAGNEIDVPIPRECKFDAEDEEIDNIIFKIEEIMENHSRFLPLYDKYRLKVEKQKNIFQENIRNYFIGYL